MDILGAIENLNSVINMNRISIELVPRTYDVLAEELAIVKNDLPNVDTVNIPDILRLDVRSWEACERAKVDFKNTIPHIRAMDFSLDKLSELLEIIERVELSEVLLVQGDAPADSRREHYDTKVVELIEALKAAKPSLKVYAALDPYRSSVIEELAYCKRKIEAGADGFFTQPFFDLNFMEVYASQLAPLGTEVFWGVSPVLTERSHQYWINRNHAFFPKDFTPTLEWNRDFARKALSFIKLNGGHIYFMPIKADIKEYLGDVL